MNLSSLLGQIIPLYTKTDFLLTVLLTLVFWYVASIGLAHIIFGAGNHSAVESAKRGMMISLLILALALATGTYFFFKPNDLIYLSAITLTFLVLGFILSVIFSRMGAKS